MPLPSPNTASDSCCVNAWRTEQAAYCGECGSPVLKCMAHEECGGVLDKSGLCPECVDFRVLVDAGAVSSVRVGGALSLSLIVENLASVGRPLIVTGAWTQEPGQDWQPVDLPWERLDAGRQAPMPVRAEALDRPGTHRLGIRLAVATRWRWREERYLFEGGILLTVEGETGATTVNQTITLQAETIGSGATVYNPLRITEAAGREEAASREPVAIPLIRAERAERRLAIRGYGDAAPLPRRAVMDWRGFADGDCPSPGPLNTEDTVLAFGRSRARPRGGPNDVRLVVEAAGGGLDEDLSLAISRRHFEVYVENDRLMLRVESGQGVRLNDDVLKTGDTAILADGDEISPLVRNADRLSLRVRFDCHADEVDRVTFIRYPAATEA